MPPTAINVVASKRSGHHAFVEWLRTNAPNPREFRNNLPLDARYGRVMVEAAETGRDLIVNFEGVTRAGLARAQAAQRAAGFASETVVFLRDPLTTIASLVHRKPFPALSLASLVRQTEALRVWLAARRAPEPGLRHVGYNAWLRDADYRRRAALAFGLVSADPPARITPEGGGSSFGEADASDVAALTARWRVLKDDAFFRAVVSHPLYRETFEATYEGALPDSFGGDFRDADALAFLSGCWRDRRPARVLDRVIDTLHRRTDLLEEMEETAGRARRWPVLRLWAAALTR
jgi:hypothetical protein